MSAPDAVDAVAPRPGPLWRDGRFARFWAGQTVSQFGDRISELALPLVAVGTLHAGAAQVSRLTALAWAPSLLGLVLGAWVDRSPSKRRLMVAADLLSACTLLSLPVAALCGAVTLGQLYVMALLTGTAGVVFGTACSSYFVRLVPPSAYVDANSKLSAGRSASFVAGPAIGGWLVQVLTAPVAVLADALSFLASAFLVGRTRVIEPAPEAAGPSLLRRAREGLVLVVRDPVLRACLGCTTTVNFFTLLAGNGLLVLFATRTLGLTPGVIGLALGGGAVGGLCGALAAPAIARLIGVGRSGAVGAVLFPAPLALICAATGPLGARAGMLGAVEFLSAFGVMLLDVNLNSVIASAVPDALRSRVTGAYVTVNYGIRPLGALTGGALAGTLGLRGVFTVAAVGGALSVLWLLPSPVPGLRTAAQAAPPSAVPAQGRPDGGGVAEPGAVRAP
ncbi:MFS transporter [Streptomyces mangrovisoli]|uniref:MFS transporter n=1 Tax=Streptomyces mangrovisoli TaxID=1428628 RepID=UPI0009A0CACA|nr:MFS transporter [Streptomyces mangrovisoli]